jgi:hypothetical protein
MTDKNYADTPVELGLDPDEEPEDPTPNKMTLFEATEAMAAQLMRISKRTKMSETGILNVFSFQWQEIERDRARTEAAALQAISGQASIDAIAEEEAARTADEVITADE